MSHLHSPLHSMTPLKEIDDMVNIVVNIQDATAVTAQLLKLKIPFKLEYQKPKIAQSSSSVSSPDVVATKNKTKALEAYIMANIDKPTLSGSKLAEELGIKYTDLKAMCLGAYGTTWCQVCLNKRMEHAAQLLKEGYKCSEVSIKVGYGEKSAIKFNKMFQRHFGITPKKYQMAHLEN